MNTTTPSFARALAIASPNPALDPVTKARFPFNFPSLITRFLFAPDNFFLPPFHRIGMRHHGLSTAKQKSNFQIRLFYQHPPSAIYPPPHFPIPNELEGWDGQQVRQLPLQLSVDLRQERICLNLRMLWLPQQWYHTLPHK